MSEEVQEWTKIPGLETTRFGALVVDLKEMQDQADDLDTRIRELKTLILEEHRPLLEQQPIRVLDRVVSWRPPSKPSEKLDRAKLIQAGVTPDQLAKGTVVGAPRAGYLELRKTPLPT